MINISYYGLFWKLQAWTEIWFYGSIFEAGYGTVCEVFEDELECVYMCVLAMNK